MQGRVNMIEGISSDSYSESELEIFPEIRAIPKEPQEQPQHKVKIVEP